MITFPTDTREKINQMRGAIGRDVTFFSEIKTSCPVCGGIDPLFSRARDPYCPSCSGVGEIISYSGVSLSGHISWGKIDSLQWVPGGQYYNGDCGIQIEYTAENLAVVNSSVFVVADNIKLDIRNKILRGVPELNRILLDCIEQGKED